MDGKRDEGAGESEKVTSLSIRFSFDAWSISITKIFHSQDEKKFHFYGIE